MITIVLLIVVCLLIVCLLTRMGVQQDTSLMAVPPSIKDLKPNMKNLKLVFIVLDIGQWLVGSTCWWVPKVALLLIVMPRSLTCSLSLMFESSTDL